MKETVDPIPVTESVRDGKLCQPQADPSHVAPYGKSRQSQPFAHAGAGTARPAASVMTAASAWNEANRGDRAIDGAIAATVRWVPGRRQETAPPEQTNAENFYYQKQMQSRTPMVIVLRDGEEVRGIIEWYDRNCIKVNREDGEPNLMIYKPAIKYMYKEGENQR